MSALQSSVPRVRLLTVLLSRSRERRLNRQLGLLLCVLTLTLLVVSLTGCATQPPPCEPLPTMPPPALTEPLPSESYSISVQRLIKSWVNALTGTSTTSEP